MKRPIETLLLLALPASGKSEVRKFLDSLSPEERRDELALGPTVQLDDFPYVHLMRRIDDELVAAKKERVFFVAPDKSFKRGEDWGTLIELVNDDHRDLVERRPLEKGRAGERLLAKIDAAAKRVGIEPRLAGLAPLIARALDAEAAALESDLQKTHVPLEGKTLVIEFARGGKQGSSMPLAAPFGYAYSIAQLSPAILEKAKVLYVWVTPEESRRKNRERANPNDPGSILHHGVPEHVMLNEYGCDDMEWLVDSSPKKGTIRIESRGKTYQLPVARFDNRVDKTSFVRGERAQWRKEDVKALRDGLGGALKQLAAM